MMEKIINWFKKDEDLVEKENRQLRKRNKQTKKEFDDIKEEKDEIMNKYMAILEEKAKGFDQYLYYQNLYDKAYSTNKEQKKEIADLKSEIKILNETLEDLQSTSLKKDKEIERLKKSVEKRTKTDIKEVVKGVEKNEEDKK